ncbi:MAG: hypothetical protein IJF54_01140 [Clostridia bacterium]|nr:hypothetical protein [Clostridia bacterium]
MKKLLCVLLAALLFVTCLASCGDKPAEDKTTVTTTASTTAQTFKKPDNYASVVLVTINPQFKLYLDANGTVLAVEPVNKDAKSIETKISFENKKVDTVVNTIIQAANDSGFVKKDVVIDVKVTEVVNKEVAPTQILDQIKTSANDKLEELEIKAEVTTSVEITEQPTSESTTAAPTTVQNTTTAKPVCKHTNVKFSTVTGSNTIDSSKLDIINHKKVCADCGETIALEKHTVKNGKCAICGQSNFNTSKITAKNAGVSGSDIGHVAVEINADGTPDFDYMMQEAYYSIGFDNLQKYLNEEDWMYEIPEADFYKALKSVFVIDDAMFAKLKAKAKYHFFWCDHTYSNGYFYIPYMAAGDVADYTHDLIGYKDDKKGTLTVYYDYLKGGADFEAADRVHQFYYAMEFTYSGASNFAISKVDDEGYVYYELTGWTPVVKSLRIKSIKKVTDISGITKVK